MKKQDVALPYPWLFRESHIAEQVKLVLGIVMVACFGPYVIFQVAVCQLWEFVDKHTVGFIQICSRISDAVSPFFSRMTKSKEDGFMVPLFVWLGLVLPAWFFYELWHATTYGFSLRRVLVYNVIRIGPMYMNFMYVYVLCHKEAHCFGNLFTPFLMFDLGYVFNRFVGLFHGVLPATFTYSHVYNHHKHHNSAYDVYCTAFRPRDRFTSWIRYIPEWFGYASNVSSILAFMEEGRYRLAIMSSLWTVYYWVFVGVCYSIQPTFTMFTLVYAFVEGNILLSVVNYVWHAFVDPNDPTNEFTNSTTIVEGLNFTLAEEYHVVHHQYAGAHWTTHRKLYEKHMEGYTKGVPSAFYKVNIFELFAHIVSGNYPEMIKLFYKPLRGDLSDEQLASILQARLQCHGPELAMQIAED
jgi:hypothetical protein